MVHIASDFEPLLRVYDLDELDRQPNTIYAVRSDFTLAYHNAQWTRFAEENGGEPAISTSWSMGRCILEALAEPILGFYESAYRGCLETGEPFSHEFECSAPDLQRRLQQMCYPLGDGKGLLISNSIVVEEPHPGPAREGQTEDHVDANGILTQCCHCRRVRHARQADRWDWIPRWVQNPPENTSHGLCTLCLEHYYPEEE